ncbi:RNase adapter RapZ [Allobaculum mucilyticum]|uniref:RNase adapter RapZ n=1 Tax=Allobaculum mucilyticum TaxID=2834459 RepID=UPI001E538D1D|nr:RNase adapter RapZ [Allobaculum mucilyticum]UNT96836.1 RNase adapter RapZ [Allobaculum mucilyticum]
MEKQLVLITGMSGAGKTSAMNALADLGYNAIDNFPKELLGSLETLMESDDPAYDRLALSASSQDYVDFMNFFDALNRPLKVIFVDASDDELLLRYRFTRRLHPLLVKSEASTLEEAIELERDSFRNLEENMKDTLHIDTTRLTPQALVNTLKSYFRNPTEPEFAITFQSFGFKHGLPMDADEIIDVRFLPNPFYEPELKGLTGNDEKVYKYVMEREETREFARRLKNYLDFVFEAYRSQNKNHMIVAIGCTGGQHRSVSICNWLTEQYKGQFKTYKFHRDAARESES